ncbi:MAG: hypothetical protein AUK44_00620 [Porphyromonadaceae bacterium CG2_30_38_12]|nr:MAG: hypothetical protein AUK44_00620 [Porphyromonadaceae bacterium CG2_30_38_12]
MKTISIVISVILFSLCLHAQETTSINKVPKQYSLEGGYRNLFSVIDNANALNGNKVMNGYGFLFDYAWKLSGLNGKKPGAFISVPIGYSVLLPANAASTQMSLLSYGWTVRHELAVNKPLVPFVGYGLLLNTLKDKARDGGAMGHQTQFEFGYNLNTATRLKYFAKIAYSYTSFPQFDSNKRIHYQFADLRVGVRF